jgi:hypothetical protein
VIAPLRGGTDLRNHYRRSLRVAVEVGEVVHLVGVPPLILVDAEHVQGIDEGVRDRVAVL